MATQTKRFNSANDRKANQFSDDVLTLCPSRMDARTAGLETEAKPDKLINFDEKKKYVDIPFGALGTVSRIPPKRQ